MWQGHEQARQGHQDSPIADQSGSVYPAAKIAHKHDQGCVPHLQKVRRPIKVEQNPELGATPPSPLLPTSVFPTAQWTGWLNKNQSVGPPRKGRNESRGDKF